MVKWKVEGRDATATLPPSGHNINAICVPFEFSLRLFAYIFISQKKHVKKDKFYLSAQRLYTFLSGCFSQVEKLARDQRMDKTRTERLVC